MASIHKLEDLKTWQVAREFTNKIYDLTEKLPPKEKYNLADQMRRAARSIMANIAEGFGRFFFKESAKFYGDARGSLLEVRSDLYLGCDRKYYPEKTRDEYLTDADRLGRLINGLISSSYRSSKLYKTERVTNNE